MKREIVLGLLTSRPLDLPDEGSAFLRLLLTLPPRLFPERYGNSEPLKYSFDAQELDAVVGRAWRDPFLWGRRRPRVEGSLWMGRGAQHSALHFRAPLAATSLAELKQFFFRAAEELRPDYGYIHAFADQEIDDAADPQATVMPFQRGLSSHDLRKCIPNLCVANFFGPPYVRLFGRERVLSCPASEIQPVGPDAIYLQVGGELGDVADQWKAFRVQREAVKAYLDVRAFFVHGGASYRTPAFDSFQRCDR